MPALGVCYRRGGEGWLLLGGTDSSCIPLLFWHCLCVLACWELGDAVQRLLAVCRGWVQFLLSVTTSAVGIRWAELSVEMSSPSPSCQSWSMCLVPTVIPVWMAEQSQGETQGRTTNTSPELGALGWQSCLWNHSNSESQTPSLQCFLTETIIFNI